MCGGGPLTGKQYRQLCRDGNEGKKKEKNRSVLKRKKRRTLQSTCARCARRGQVKACAGHHWHKRAQPWTLPSPLPDVTPRAAARAARRPWTTTTWPGRRPFAAPRRSRPKGATRAARRCRCPCPTSRCTTPPRCRCCRALPPPARGTGTRAGHHTLPHLLRTCCAAPATARCWRTRRAGGAEPRAAQPQPAVARQRSKCPRTPPSLVARRQWLLGESLGRGARSAPGHASRRPPPLLPTLLSFSLTHTHPRSTAQRQRHQGHRPAVRHHRGREGD